MSQEEKFQKIAADVLTAVGGKDNVSLVTHCMTRLRLNLKDESIPNQEEIKKIPGVIGVVNTGGQLQIIIGQSVPKVYSAFCKAAGIAEQSALNENLDEKKEKLTPKRIGSNILNYLSGSMTPMIPAMITAAMFKTVQVIIGPDMLGIAGTDSNIYMLCSFMYSAFFYFLPIFLGFTAAKKLNMNPIMGLYAAALLLVPDFMALADSGTAFTVYGIPAPVNNYSQTVLPVILTIWVMSYIDRFFRKVVPDVLSTIFAPFLTMVVMVPLELCLFAPLGSILGGYVGNGLLAFGNVGGFIAVAVVAALWEFLVMTGMHQVLIVFGITAMMTNGVDNFVLTAGGYATWAAFGMALGAFLRLKNKSEKSLSLGYFISGILGGVTEPVLYGIGFKYKRPFIAMAIGGFCGGLYAGITGVGTYVMGATNFLAVLGYVGGGTANMINGCIGVAISLVVSAVLTYLFGFTAEDLKAE
ncbi:PTS transporter subunit EIIC [Konateibacter massiliensis]|uniref:PTS transporter subunit EIIC n=1 Tax=Konateibacter massiliensis TaxID=2002841 RepID=UPI000C15287E|nr:PTS transporter subunit EIIC [Konateibacter massiliensis]